MAKKQFRPSRCTWFMPVVYALPVMALAAAALLIWGDKIRELIGIVVKLAVIS